MKMVHHSNKRITSKKLYYIYMKLLCTYYYSIQYTTLLKSCCCPKFCQKLRLSTMKAAAVVLLYAALRSLRQFFPAMRSTQPYYITTSTTITSLPLSLPLKFSQVEIWQEQIWQRLLLDGEISFRLFNTTPKILN